MYLEDVIASVDATHKGLGKLVAMCQLAVVARKIMLIVSPSGCGKSTAMSYVSKTYGANVMRTDSTSRTGLVHRASELDCSDRLIVVDDLSTTQTPYARASTMTALAALCYSHEVHSDMGDISFSIENFNGSVLVGIQPVILKELLLVPEWEGTIKDKVIRYYHLRRPTEPALHEPACVLKNADIGTVELHEPDKENIYWQHLFRLGLMEFSRARAKEHLIDLLKASCALDGRTKVTQDDYEMLELLLRQFVFEVISINKKELEGDRELNRNLMNLLTEYYSYEGEFSLGQVATDYQVTLQQCYKIMKTQSVYWNEITKSPTTYKPTQHLTKILKKYNLEA